MAKTAKREQPSKPRILEQVTTPAPVSQEPAPVSTETKPPKAKRDQSQRRAPLPAETATLIFNEAAYNAKPKRKGSAAEGRIALYPRGEGFTVAQLRKAYADAGLKNPKAKANSNVRWDLAHGYVSVQEPVAS